MKIESSDHGDLKLVKLTGRLDGQAPDDLRKTFPEWFKVTSVLVIDCSDLDYINSNGLGSLISGLRTAIKQGGDIRLAKLQPKVKMMFELTRTDQVFGIFNSVEEALNSFQKER